MASLYRRVPSHNVVKCRWTEWRPQEQLQSALFLGYVAFPVHFLEYFSLLNAQCKKISFVSSKYHRLLNREWTKVSAACLVLRP